MVNDNLFTNVMARFNLAKAAKVDAAAASSDLPKAYQRVVAPAGSRAGPRSTSGPTAPTRWPSRTTRSPGSTRRTRTSWTGRSGTWRTPRPEKRPLLLHYHPLVIYRFQVLKQADVVLALFLQGDHFSLEQKRADFEYYDPITTGDSTLSGVVQSIIAAEVGYRELALRYFHSALFVDLADLHGNTTDGVHVASTGGVWNCLAYGFGGMRDYNGVVTFDPRLPESWDGV